MSKQKYIPFIAIVTIIIMVAMVMVLSNKDNSNHTATEISSVEETLITEETPTEETTVTEERFTAEEKLGIRKIFSQIETLPSELTTTELKLFGYYVILSDADFRNILTENDVQAIITELKQFQPKDIDKFLHHKEDFLIYADDIAIKHDNINRFYLTYQERQIKFSATIDEILLRAVTEHPKMHLYYSSGSTFNPLFMELASGKNNNIIPLVQFFLDNGVDINVRNPKFGNTIFYAVGTLEIAQFLLNNGADPNILTNGNYTPLISAINGEDSNELIKFLIDIGVDIHVKSPNYGTALDTAKDKVKGLEYDIWHMENSSDSSPGDEFLHTRLEKAEEVVRIIEQALEADEKP